MRVHAIGVVRRKGIGKDTGAPYDFAQLMYIRPIETVNTDKFQMHGYGFEQATLDMELGALDKFAQVRFPLQLELETIQEPGRKAIRVLVSGFKTEKAAA